MHHLPQPGGGHPTPVPPDSLSRSGWRRRSLWPSLLVLLLPATVPAQVCPPTLTIVPSSLGMPVGTTAQLWTVATDSGHPVFPPISWMSVAWDTAQVDSRGTVTAMRAGQSTIWASTPRGTRASAKVDVGPAPSLVRVQGVTWPGLGTWTWPQPATLYTGIYPLSFADSAGSIVAYGQLAIFR